MKHYPTLDILAIILLVVGGVQLGIMGLTGFDILEAIFHGFSKVIYIAVGLSAAYRILLWAKTKMGK